jgi:hypothetical protein
MLSPPSCRVAFLNAKGGSGATRTAATAGIRHVQQTLRCNRRLRSKQFSNNLRKARRAVGRHPSCVVLGTCGTSEVSTVSGVVKMCHMVFSFCIFFQKTSFSRTPRTRPCTKQDSIGFFDTLRSMCVAVKLLRDDRCSMHHQLLRRHADCCSSFCSDGMGWVGGLAGVVVAVGAQNRARLHLNPCSIETEQQEEKVARRSNYSRVSPRLPWARSIGFLLCCEAYLSEHLCRYVMDSPVDSEYSGTNSAKSITWLICYSGQQGADF